MKGWRIHVGWAIAALLGAVVSARVASRRDTPEAPPVLRASAARAADPPTTDSGSPGTGALPTREADAVPAPVGSVPSDGLEERVRALLKNPQDWGELERLVESIADRELKLRLLREAVFGKDRQSVGSAINLLGRMKGRDVAGILEDYFKAHAEEEIGANVANALGVVGDPGSMPVLIDALQSRNPQVRLWCAEALLSMGYSAPALDLISDMARQYESPDGAMRRKAVETVSQFNTGGIVPLLTRALKDSNGDVRMAALAGFLNLNSSENIPLLEPLLNDPLPEVADQAKEYIEALRHP